MLRLVNGDYVKGPDGMLMTVSGFEELLQRVLMKLSARRGGFAPMPGFGSRLHLLLRESPARRDTSAREYVFEALSDEDVEIESVMLTERAEGAFLRVTLNADGKRAELEVPV